MTRETIAEILGLPEDETEVIRVSALMHDVGKIGIQDSILGKAGPLTDEEYEIMKTHPSVGAAIMEHVPQLEHMMPGIRCHHENIDGSGYPDGLKGDEIPLMAKIVSVADTFDAMTTNRPYQKAMEISYVFARMRSFIGKKFEEHIVEALVARAHFPQVPGDQVAAGDTDGVGISSPGVLVLDVSSIQVERGVAGFIADCFNLQIKPRHGEGEIGSHGYALLSRFIIGVGDASSQLWLIGCPVGAFNVSRALAEEVPFHPRTEEQVVHHLVKTVLDSHIPAEEFLLHGQHGALAGAIAPLAKSTERRVAVVPSEPSK